MAPGKASGRTVTPKSNVVHQAAHDKDSKPAAALVGLDSASNRRRAEPPPAILDLDLKLVAVEVAIDGEAGKRGPVSVLDGIAQRFAGR
jgi:hypothetical protein